jgi:hypothetical protein
MIGADPPTERTVMRTLLWVVAWLVLGLGGARAQAPDAKGPDTLAQMQLSDAQIQQFLEAQPDLDAAMKDAPQQDADAPDPKLAAKLEEVAKKHKFANYGELDTVAGNIALVLEGVDEKTKKYIGAPAALKKQIAALQANKNIPPDDKKAELAELNGELQSIVPVKFKANIDLVLKYYDQLAVDQGDQKP